MSLFKACARYEKLAMCKPGESCGFPPRAERDLYDTEYGYLFDAIDVLRKERKEGWIEKAMQLQQAYDKKWEKWKRKWYPSEMDKYLAVIEENNKKRF